MNRDNFYTLRVRKDRKAFYLAHGSSLEKPPPFLWFLVEKVARAYKFRNIAVAIRVVRGVVHGNKSLAGWKWEIFRAFNGVVESGITKKPPLAVRSPPHL